tara:strand:+ start:1041 stop:2018 length:978 start_codon:yes stop_codon:yes gene_type:complete
MIIKPFELKKVNFQNSLLNLVYGDNQGYKEQIINDYFLKNFKGDVSRYEENDILNNSEIFISNLLNKSLFENEKIIIITRVTEKILNIFIEIYERQISGTKIIINANFLEKKSKLRNFFEKKKEIICVPVYEDDNKSLNELVLNFFKNKNKKFSQEIINLLIVRAKGDRKNLQNELLKIENLSLSKKNIEIEDVMKLTNLAENFSVFELSDNYLAKNSRKVSHILNENNYNSDDCILIIRTIISKSKRLLKLKKEIDKNNNVDLVLSSFKPPIFWKEKEIVKKQAQSWSTKEVKRIIYKLNDLELIVKKNSMNSLNFVSDFVRNY